MKAVLVIVLCCLLGANAYLKGTKIIGGQEAAPGQFPFICSLRNAGNRGHFCGGAIISDRFVVTAGHCFADNRDPANSVVYVGSNDLNGNGQYYQLARVVVHEQYDPTYVVNDITLLQTANPIQMNANVGTIKLPDSGLVLPQDTPVVALGWGTTSYPDQNYPNLLHYVPLGVVDNPNCQSYLETLIADSQICVGGVYGSGLCFGDSGSPLVWNGDTTVGIVSWGRPCGIGKPDVFTRDSAFVDWIRRNQAILEALDQQ